MANIFYFILRVVLAIFQSRRVIFMSASIVKIMQVITEALRRQANLHLEALDSPAAFKIRQNPRFKNNFK